MKNIPLSPPLLLVALGAIAACGSPVVTGYQIEMASGEMLQAVPGDAVGLAVLQNLSNNTTMPLPPGAQVVWSGPPVVKALATNSKPSESALPGKGALPATMWLDNPDHFTPAQLAGVLWVLDAGTTPGQSIEVRADITGVDPPGTASAKVPIFAELAGDVARGKISYVANCAECHGVTGHGTSEFPGLNAESGNVAGDPLWSAPLLAMSARGNIDNMGVSLKLTMPKWLLRTGADGKLLTTQEFMDIYAWLKTQIM